MDILVSHLNGLIKVALRGRLDTAGVGLVESDFVSAVVPGDKSAIIDLAKVEFLGSLGVRMFISTARSLSLADRSMVLYGATERVTDILQITALDELMPIVASEDEAIELTKA